MNIYICYWTLPPKMPWVNKIPWYISNNIFSAKCKPMSKHIKTNYCQDLYMLVYILQLPLPIYNAANKIYTNEKQNTDVEKRTSKTRKKKKKNPHFSSLFSRQLANWTSTNRRKPKYDPNKKYKRSIFLILYYRQPNNV